MKPARLALRNCTITRQGERDGQDADGQVKVTAAGKSLIAKAAKGHNFCGSWPFRRVRDDCADSFPGMPYAPASKASVKKPAGKASRKRMSQFEGQLSLRRWRDIQRTSTAVPSFKTKDLAPLIDFLERESRHYELFRNALEVIAGIGSLGNAAAEARRELEAVQADLAWAKAELEKVQGIVVAAKGAAFQQAENFRFEMETRMTLIRCEHEEEVGQLQGAILKERMALSKVGRRVEVVQTAAGLIVKMLQDFSGSRE